MSATLGSVSLLRSFGFALDGISYLIRTQRNARIEVAIGIVVLALAAWLRVTAIEGAVLVLTIALVLALEALNTAIELAVALASPERHLLARVAKDVWPRWSSSPRSPPPQWASSSLGRGSSC